MHGFTSRNNMVPAFEDRARKEAISRLRGTKTGPVNERDRVMIQSREGFTDNITTGISPKFKEEDRNRWAEKRKEAEIEKMFRLP